MAENIHTQKKNKILIKLNEHVTGLFMCVLLLFFFQQNNKWGYCINRNYSNEIFLQANIVNNEKIATDLMATMQFETTNWFDIRKRHKKLWHL